MNHGGVFVSALVPPLPSTVGARKIRNTGLQALVLMAVGDGTPCCASPSLPNANNALFVQQLLNFFFPCLSCLAISIQQAYDQVPFFPHVDLSIQVLGFWFVWLFTVPSLRARKPGPSEKVALDIAFLATPVVSFAMPFITKVGRLRDVRA